MFSNGNQDANFIRVRLKEIQGLVAVIQYEQNGEICRIPIRYIPEDCNVGDVLFLKISKTATVSEEETEAIARKLLEKFVNPNYV